MNPSSALIGIDVGTTAVKATLYRSTGEVLAHRSSAYPTDRPRPNVVEQNPAHWMQAVLDSLTYFAEELPRDAVQAIGLTSQVNTHVFVGDDGRVLAPAIVWQDSRAAEEAAMLDAPLCETQRMNWWGAPMPIDASHALARMLWMQRHQPGIWQKTRHVMLPKDYCLWQLTGQLISDPLANIGMVDTKLAYADGLLDRVDGAAERVLPLAQPTDVAGTLRHDLPFAGTPVAVGTMDAWAGMLGTGVCKAGSGMYLSGTSEVLGIIAEQMHPTPGVLVMPRCENIRLHVGPTQSGGASQLWFCELFGISPDTMSQLAGSLADTDRVPLFLPHLEGERAPLWDARSRGVFLGLDSSTSRAAMASAVYEGVACSARWLLDSLQSSTGIEVDALCCGGGGFRSDAWNQIRADMLGVTLQRVAVTDPGTLGAAGVAAVASGLHDSLVDALDNLVHIDREYLPNPQSHDRCAERMALYRDTYRHTAELSARWLDAGHQNTQH